MKLHRDNIFKKYEWLREKNRPFIISSNYDGIICASFLSHYLNWKLVGYYDYNNIWLSDHAVKNKKNIIWVDLNILPETGKSLGGHIVFLDDKYPKGLLTSCNPNILAKINAENFKNKFPFSTLIFLLWLHDIKITDQIAKLFVLHSDNSWMKIQKYKENISFWTDMLSEYSWGKLINDVDSIDYEKNVDQYLYPKLINLGETTFGKLKSNYLGIKSRELKINPDWDLDIILKLISIFANILNWTPPEIPIINRKIKGKKVKVDLKKIKKYGLNSYIKNNKIFSYAISSPKDFSYTIFNKKEKK